MRTTLTIEDDVAREIEARMRQEGRSLKEVVNDLLRRGLSTGGKHATRPRRFKVSTFSSGLLPGIDPGRLNSLVDDLAAEDFQAKRGRER